MAEFSKTKTNGKGYLDKIDLRCDVDTEFFFDVGHDSLAEIDYVVGIGYPMLEVNNYECLL